MTVHCSKGVSMFSRKPRSCMMEMSPWVIWGEAEKNSGMSSDVRRSPQYLYIGHLLSAVPPSRLKSPCIWVFCKSTFAIQSGFDTGLRRESCPKLVAWIEQDSLHWSEKRFCSLTLMTLSSGLTSSPSVGDDLVSELWKVTIQNSNLLATLAPHGVVIGIILVGLKSTHLLTLSGFRVQGVDVEEFRINLLDSQNEICVQCVEWVPG